MSDPSSAPETAAPQTAAPRFATRSLSHRKPTRFHWQPGPEARAALARSLDLQGIGRLSFKGEILPEGRSDFRLEARLQAQATQSCIVTLAPVPARIDAPVLRRFLADYADPDGEEIEIPADDVEPLPAEIEIEAIAREALALALPDYPRAEGAELGEAVFAAPDTQALTDAELKPFAGLARLIGAAGGDGAAGPAPEPRDAPAREDPADGA
ncbi:DUF177 domain-containing protein [Pseudogemmobacter sonorensis]|uniref:DUF177 domain-containing protein n=1 Tax=Pseudogemmobacter sonorensis TaxID=2989681 RepID=UPI0036D1475E